MKSERNMRAEIASGERWLGAADGSPPAPDVDALKQRVRIAAGEQWLRQQDRLSAPADLAARMKRRIWHECGRLQRIERRAGIVRRVRRWGTAAASLAACIMLAVVANRSAPTGAPGGAPGSVPSLDRWMASLQGPASDVDVSLALLEQDVRMLERSIAAPESVAVDVDAAMLDDLFDDSDRLMAELEADLG